MLAEELPQKKEAETSYAPAQAVSQPVFPGNLLHDHTYCVYWHDFLLIIERLWAHLTGVIIQYTPAAL